MTLTEKQAYVLANIERIELWPYKLRTPSRRTRFLLDGWECTAQVTSLVVKKKVRHLACGLPERLAGGSAQALAAGS